VVKFNDVVKKYQNGTVALSDVNVNIKKGEFVFIIGPSGSGKSTFIKLIMKEEDVTEGEVFLTGYNVSSMSRKEIP
jgi:cell division transport system ATP-binding protein